MYAPLYLQAGPNAAVPSLHLQRLGKHAVLRRLICRPSAWWHDLHLGAWWLLHRGPDCGTPFGHMHMFATHAVPSMLAW